jgi:uncharacterized integral membrane protein (TIGR00698 family)
MTSGRISGYQAAPGRTTVVRVNPPSARTTTGANRLLPGLIAAAVGTTAAFVAALLLPTVSALTIAVGLGVLVGQLLPTSARAGLGWATRRFLRLGVALLGLQLGLGQVLGLGVGTVAVVATVVVAFTGTLFIARLIGASSGLALMVATGFSICGASAIAAMDSVTRTDEEDVATAITLVTIYGSAAIGLVPLVGNALGMTPGQLGAWAGLSVHEVAQVVAAASPAGAAAVTVGVVVKLTRVVLLAPIVAGVTILRRRRGTTTESGGRPPLVPLFVLGFLAAILLRSTGTLPTPVLSAAQAVTTILFAASLFALGTSVRPAALLRNGRRGLALGAASTLLVGLVGLAALATTGTAWSTGS